MEQDTIVPAARPQRRQRERRSTAGRRATRISQTFAFPAVPALTTETTTDQNPTNNDQPPLPNVPQLATSSGHRVTLPPILPVRPAPAPKTTLTNDRRRKSRAGRPARNQVAPQALAMSAWSEVDKLTVDDELGDGDAADNKLTRASPSAGTTETRPDDNIVFVEGERGFRKVDLNKVTQAQQRQQAKQAQRNRLDGLPFNLYVQRWGDTFLSHLPATAFGLVCGLELLQNGVHDDTTLVHLLIPVAPMLALSLHIVLGLSVVAIVSRLVDIRFHLAKRWLRFAFLLMLAATGIHASQLQLWMRLQLRQDKVVTGVNTSELRGITRVSVMAELPELGADLSSLRSAIAAMLACTGLAFALFIWASSQLLVSSAESRRASGADGSPAKNDNR
eukprot:TRINITY_DN8652_c0_g1_i2.p1 TRINITY_DN8652_c0_g1~~TRINITY_DN8652_c0_g1_i2.p1  ORF type:complete len:391 (+),score=63.80 TRINITY_DN8652_c0_g1_i2:160-1332(+)